METTKSKVSARPPLAALFKSVKRIDDQPEHPRASAARPTEVQELLQEGLTLAAATDEQLKLESAARGNGALYELLGKLYDYGLRIAESPMNGEVIEQLREAVRKPGSKPVDPQTPLMTLVIKYVVRADNRQTIHNYSRALRVAHSYGVQSGGFVNFVNEKKGLQNLTQTKEEKEKSEKRQQKRKERAQTVRQTLQEVLDTAEKVECPKDLAWVEADKDESKGEFTLVVARRDGRSLRLGVAFSLPRPDEEKLMDVFAGALRDEGITQ